MAQINKQNFEGAVYSAPSISALDIELEGVLCASGTTSVSGGFTISDWQNDGESLAF